jgi:hypothetical protein
MLVVIAAAGSARGDTPQPRWIAVPSFVPSTHAVVRFGIGEAEAAGHRYDSEPRSMIAVISMVRIGVRVAPQIELSLTASEDFSERGMYLAAPALAATWATARDGTYFAVRGAAAVAVERMADRPPGNLASSLLAHDPLVASAQAYTALLQGAAAFPTGPVRSSVAVMVSDARIQDETRHQSLLRVDGALQGQLDRCWTWELELGLVSDLIDEEYDEGTDVVPLWSASIHHHRGTTAIGASLTGGYVGGERGSMIGPSALIDWRGDL